MSFDLDDLFQSLSTPKAMISTSSTDGYCQRFYILSGVLPILGNFKQRARLYLRHINGAGILGFEK